MATPVKKSNTIAGIPATTHNAPPHTTRGTAPKSRTPFPHLTAIHVVGSKIADPTAEGTDYLKEATTTIEKFDETSNVPTSEPERGIIKTLVAGGHLNLEKMTTHPAANCP